jgi:hypothetical protein
MSTFYMNNHLQNSNVITNIQIAIVQVASTGFSILFSVPFLLKSGYLVSCAILLRAFLDRLGTLAYFASNPTKAFEIWNRGWLHNDKERPSFETKLRCLENYVGDRPELTHLKFKVDDHLINDWLKILHSSTHGDPQDAAFNSEAPTKDELSYIAGPDFKHPERCSELASLGTLLVGQFLHEINRSLPFLEKPLG